MHADARMHKGSACLLWEKVLSDISRLMVPVHLSPVEVCIWDIAPAHMRKLSCKQMYSGIDERVSVMVGHIPTGRCL